MRYCLELRVRLFFRRLQCRFSLRLRFVSIFAALVQLREVEQRDLRVVGLRAVNRLVGFTHSRGKRIMGSWLG